ncbi:MAG: hypothetical protein K2W85_04810 [Phycisphaerales bacterium]|nr:hypothetical protein [Phycisphaerales bacterium]
MMHRLVVGLLALTTLALPGCALFRSEPGGVLTAVSTDGSRELAPTFTTAAYSFTDENTAEVFLTDLPRERIEDPRDMLGTAQGVILHLHIFLDPSPGDTPIDATACNVTIRQLVVTGTTGETGTVSPTMGLYAGGGFVLLRGSIGDASITGSMTGGSYRLTRSTPGFADRLGAGKIAGRFSATQDPDLARSLSARFESLVRKMPAPVMEPDPTIKPMPIRVKPPGGGGGSGRSSGSGATPPPKSP